MVYTKPIIAAFLALVFMLPTIYIIGTHLQQVNCRIHVENNFEKKNMQRVQIQPSEIIWLNNKEIIIDGQMFDVKKVTKNKDGTVTLAGVYDERETQIKKQLEEITCQRNMQHLPVVKLIFQSVAYCATNGFCFSIQYITCIINLAWQTEKTCRGFSSVAFPPPRFI